MKFIQTLPTLAVAASIATEATRDAPRADPDTASADEAGAGREAVPALDRQTFQEFYDRTSASLRRYLLRVCADPAQAEDVFQESYVRLINRPGLRLDSARLRSYLFRTATNLLRDQWRRQARERNGLLEFFASVGGRSVRPASDEALDLESALAGLKPRDRAMLWLAYVEGYGHRDIASFLNLREGSVRVMLFRLRKRLVAQLSSASNQKEDEP